MSKVVTGGSAYTDIDVLACAIAYPAKAHLTAPFNETIPPSIRKWDLPFEPVPPNNPTDCEYVLVDVSDPAHFAPFVVESQIIEVLDHHRGFETYWKEKLGDKGVVEHVGSCATLVYERLDEMTPLQANLLYTAIFANTLNLQAHVTTDRDKIAFEKLKSHIDLPKDWINIYYGEIQKEIYANPLQAIQKDTKTVSHQNQTLFVSQLEVWDATPFLNLTVDRDQILLLSDIQKQVTYFFTQDQEMKKILSERVGLTFTHPHQARADRLWMRKEFLPLLTKRTGIRDQANALPN